MNNGSSRGVKEHRKSAHDSWDAYQIDLREQDTGSPVIHLVLIDWCGDCSRALLPHGKLGTQKKGRVVQSQSVVSGLWRFAEARSPSATLSWRPEVPTSL